MTRCVLAAWLLAVVVPAQAGDATKPSANQTEYDKLAAEWTAAQKTFSEGMRQVTATEEYKKARTDKDAAKIKELTEKLQRPDGKAFGARALALADKAAGEDGIRFLAQAASFGDKDTGIAVLERVQKHHLKSTRLADLLENPMALSRAVGAEAADAFLGRVVTESPHALPKAWAMYWQGKNLAAVQRKKDATEEEKTAAAAKADALFAAAAPLAAGTEFADKIGAPLFEKQHMQVGMEVPDIVGEDVDGVAFKLSDYRGKVVLIDFWGFW